MKTDKTFLSLILLFLMVLSEYPLLFPAPPVNTPIELPANITESAPPPAAHNTTVTIADVQQTGIQRHCILRPLTKPLTYRELLFTLRVPEDWNATTDWERGYGTWEGYYFYTRLGIEEPVDNQTGIAGGINRTRMTIMTYAITRNQDQDYRNDYRQNWIPTPVESVETINGITFDRFESKGEGTAVAYVAKKTSANERGYATVIWYYVSSSECQEEIEAIIHTFRYLSNRDILLGNLPGVDISIIHPER